MTVPSVRIIGGGWAGDSIHGALVACRFGKARFVDNVGAPVG